MFYLQYKALSIYPPTFTVCAHRACITIQSEKKTNTHNTDGVLLTARGFGECGHSQQIPLLNPARAYTLTQSEPQGLALQGLGFHVRLMG